MGVSTDSGYPARRCRQKLGSGRATWSASSTPGVARELIAPLPPGATFGSDPQSAKVVVLFVTERRTFASR